MERESRISRREAFAAAGALGLGAGAYLLLRGDGDGDGDRTGAGAGEPAEPAASCVLSPEQTEGPYYVEDSMVRSDVTEDRDGVPLELVLTVQDADSCEPIENATVEIWHCDAEGSYSGVQGDSGTYLRGAQRSDRQGRVTFRTIYPGWYQGRTTHIHVKVHVEGDQVHTGQLYFEDELTSAVAGRSPYVSHGEPDTTNASDGIYSNGGEQSTLALSRSGDGYTGRLSLGVRA